MIKRIFSFTKRVVSFVTGRALVYYIAFTLVCLSMINFRTLATQKLNYYKLQSFYPMSFVKAESPYNRNNFRQSIQYYSNLAVLFPQDPRINNILAVCYFYLGLQDKAVRNLETALKKKPQYLYLHYNLGIVYYHLSEYQKSFEHFRLAFPGHYVNVDLLFDLPGKIQGEKMFLDRFLNEAALSSYNAYWLKESLRVLYLDRIDDWEGQIAICQEALKDKFNVKRDFFSYHLGKALLFQGQTQAALQLLKKPIKPSQMDTKRLQLLRTYKEGIPFGQIKKDSFLWEEDFHPYFILHPLTHVLPVGQELKTLTKHQIFFKYEDSY